MAQQVRLDREGVQKVLKSAGVRRAVRRLAVEIADDVSGNHPDADVVVDDYTTDRAASSVTIRDVRGRIWQARDGVLTRAAASAGLQVTEKKR